MSPKPTPGDNKLSSETRIFAYGFDAAGFPIHHALVFLADIGRIEFIDFNDPVSFEMADGVIIPQGIFEKIESRRSTFGPRTTISVHKTSLLERERQVFNLLRAGKWVCFLVGEIVDEVSQGMHLEPTRDTDLCKRILNAFIVERRHKYHLYIDTPREVRAREKEFESYARNYGTPTTVFEFPRLHPVERHVIVEFGDQAVGIELDAQLFFLPFHSPDKNGSTALSIAKTAARAITQYRRNRIIVVPHWVDELRFKSEEELYLEINALLEKVNRLESQLLSWKDYKSILTTSGKHLKNKVVAILESVFDLKVELQDTLDSAIVRDDHERPAFMMETRSTDGDIERDFIDQIHRHRQAMGISQSVPAILFINSNASIENIAKRAEAEVPDDVVHYAKDFNVLIVRTIDLLLLMRQLENDPHRKNKLMHLLLSGEGWLERWRDHKIFL